MVRVERAFLILIRRTLIDFVCRSPKLSHRAVAGWPVGRVNTLAAGRVFEVHWRWRQFARKTYKETALRRMPPLLPGVPSISIEWTTSCWHRDHVGQTDRLACDHAWSRMTDSPRGLSP